MSKRSKKLLLLGLVVLVVLIVTFPGILRKLLVLAAIIAAIIIAVRIISNIRYRKSTYYTTTHLPQSATREDKGHRGEYEIYEKLRNLENYGVKFLFNVYIPKNDGTTTEIDVLMLTEKGIFVFESKNFGGWIFGDEKREQWCQTLSNVQSGKRSWKRSIKKEYFYNPVLQNEGHVKHLAAILGEEIPLIPIVVFSDRCELKNVSVQRMTVTTTSNLPRLIGEMYKYLSMPQTRIDINALCARLYPYTQVSEQVKQQHISNIRSGKRTATAHFTPPTSSVTSEQPAAEPVTTPEQPAAEPVTTPEQPAAEPVTTPEQPVAPASAPMPKCPLCGGDLVFRTATRGVNAGNRFFGCSNFPKCRYIQNIPNM